MKTRILTALVGVIPLVAVLLFFDTIVLNIAVALLAVIAVYELLVATKYINHLGISTTTLTFAAVAQFLNDHLLHYRPLVYLVFISIIITIFIIDHEKMKFEQLGLIFMVGTMIPMAFYTIIMIRNEFEHFYFYIMMALFGAWGADIGAYFIGSSFGKHKLAPNISPKKTIEGVVGGIVTATLFYFVLGIVYTNVMMNFDTTVHINYIILLLMAPIVAIVGVVGDLCASAIKRQCLIKDFGNIMPGHGGILDRFDSLLFTSPFIMAVITYVPIVTTVTS